MDKTVPFIPNSSKTDRIELVPNQKGLVSLNLTVTHIKEVIKEVVRYIEPPPPPPPISPPTEPPTQPEEANIDDLLDISPSEMEIGESEVLNLDDINKPSQGQDFISALEDSFSPEISDTLKEIFSESEDVDKPKPPSPPLKPQPQKIVEKIKELVEEQIFSTSIYLNALDKESSSLLKEFAKKGDSNILTSEMGLPLCVCYFYSENQASKWKIRPALIRDTCIRMKERFNKFSYYISYPLSKQFDEKEIPVIKEAIQTFVLPHSSSSLPMLILNLDIIPELEKPSIILGFEKSGIYENVKNLLSDIFGQSIDIFVDDCIFSGGLLYNNLFNWTSPSNAHVINIILSNNFISNLSLFYNLLEALSSLSLGEL